MSKKSKLKQIRKLLPCEGSFREIALKKEIKEMEKKVFKLERCVELIIKLSVKHFSLKTLHKAGEHIEKTEVFKTILLGRKNEILK